MIEWFLSLHPAAQWFVVVLSTGIIGRFGEAISEGVMEVMRRIFRL